MFIVFFSVQKHAPVWSILIISSFFRSTSRSRAECPEYFGCNCARVRSILKISSFLHQQSRSRAERPEIFEENRAPVRSILKKSRMFHVHPVRPHAVLVGSRQSADRFAMNDGGAMENWDRSPGICAYCETEKICCRV